jgi:hypothetical protein
MQIWWTRENFPWYPTLARPKEYALTKLTEVRISAEVGFPSSHLTFLHGLTDFPALKKLVLGQFMTHHMDWEGLFDKLRDTGKYRIDLDVLWLMNPLQDNNADEWTHPPYARYGNNATTLAAARGAAKEVRVIHEAFPWDDGVIKGVGKLGGNWGKGEVFGIQVLTCLKSKMRLRSGRCTHGLKRVVPTKMKGSSAQSNLYTMTVQPKEWPSIVRPCVDTHSQSSPSSKR